MAMDKDKQKNLDTALKKINKQFGEGTVTTAAEATEKLSKRIIKTPSIELNKALYGGFGSIVELYGPESSGKLKLCIWLIMSFMLIFSYKVKEDYINGKKYMDRTRNCFLERQL